jgi:hypothetical protein
MRQMGLEAIDAKPWLSQPTEDHAICPYLLHERSIIQVNYKPSHKYVG